MATVEKAIFTNNPEKYNLKDYQRLYFGNEFCEKNLLSIRRIQEIVTFAKKEGKAITFVTPFVTDKGLSMVERCLQDIPSGSEVVFNDYGILSLLKSFTPVFGRLLNKQKRGPRIVQLKGKIPEEGYSYFQHCNLELMEPFLQEKGISRAEVDNVIQGFKINTKLRLSLYYPWVYVSTTRLCLLKDIEDLGRKKITIGPCQRECHKYTLVNKSFPLPLYMKGVAQFYHNGRRPEGKYDRIVWMPEMIV